MENELELSLGNLPMLMSNSFLLPEGFFKLDFYLIIYFTDFRLGSIVLLGRGTFGLRCGLYWELRKEYVITRGLKHRQN